MNEPNPETTRAIAAWMEGEPDWHQFSRVEAYALITLVQLALRHPGLPQWVAVAGETAARNLVDRIAPPGSGVMRDLFEKGFDPAHDVKRSKP